MTLNERKLILEGSIFHDYLYVVVSIFFYFHPYLGKIPILTNIFQIGWFNHQPVMGGRVNQQSFQQFITLLRAFHPADRSPRAKAVEEYDTTETSEPKTGEWCRGDASPYVV